METKITKYYNQGEYEQIVKYLVESKTIYFIDCTCKDFEYRRIKKVGQFSDIKYYALPCKHLKPIVKVYEMQGLKLKVPKEMKGSDKCTARLRRFLIDRSGGFCECGCGKVSQEVHRKIPRTNGGKYNEDNCVLLNGECHRLITYQTWHASPGKINKKGGKNGNI